MSFEAPTQRPETLVDRTWSRLLGLLLGVATRLVEAAGIDRSLRFGAAFGRGWCVFRMPRTRRVQEQLAAAFPEQPAGEIRRLESEVFEHLGQGLAELLLMSGRHRLDLLDTMEVIGLEHLEDAVRAASGRGAVVIGPHLGNWELAAAKLAALGIPVSAVHRGLRQPALERAITRARRGPGAVLKRGRDAGQRGEAGGVHDPNDATRWIAMGPRAGVQFIRALEAGRNVLALLDQHASREEGMSVEFFGRPANTRFGPLKLAERVGAAVLIACARRDPGGRGHTLTFQPALQLESGNSDDDDVLRRNLQLVTAALESNIRSSPEQWIWTHRRWRIGGEESE